MRATTRQGPRQRSSAAHRRGDVHKIRWAQFPFGQPPFTTLVLIPPRQDPSASICRRSWASG